MEPQLVERGVTLSDTCCAALSMRRAPAGPQSVKDMPVVQDGPPPGGFPSVRIARRIPSTGPGGFTVFAVSSAIMAYGFYLVSEPVMQCSR